MFAQTKQEEEEKIHMGEPTANIFDMSGISQYVYDIMEHYCHRRDTPKTCKVKHCDNEDDSVLSCIGRHAESSDPHTSFKNVIEFLEDALTEYFEPKVLAPSRLMRPGPGEYIGDKMNLFFDIKDGKTKTAICTMSGICYMSEDRTYPVFKFLCRAVEFKVKELVTGPTLKDVKTHNTKEVKNMVESALVRYANEYHDQALQALANAATESK